LPDCAFEEEGHLRDDRYVLAERVEAHLEGIVAIDCVDRATVGLEDAEEGLDDGRLSCSCSADNAHLLVGSYFEVEISEDKRQIVVVPCRKSPKLYCWHGWPLLMYDLTILDSLHLSPQSNFFVISRPKFFLFFEALQFQYSLGAHHQAFHQNDLDQDPAEVLANGDQIHDCHSIESNRCGAELSDADDDSHCEQHDRNECLVEAEPSGDHVETHGALDGLVDNFGKFDDI
jgi:hypothetical protein